MKEAFDKNGFILVRNILTQAEVTKLQSAVDNSCGVRRHAYNHATDGTTSRMCVWNHPGDDVTGVLVRTPRVVDTFEQAKKRLQHMYIEMKAGDMLFFHCNLFHCSENTSDHRRWVFVVAFNKRSNG
ncbi:putative Phytanoyl-CoA dioxygenase (PhyH)-containing protein 1, partial [Homarus americanus]